jgi:hypothetical protein
MKKILFLFFLCFLLIEFSKGQITFQKTYGQTCDTRAYSVQQTTDKGYVLTGYTLNNGCAGSDIYLVKTDSIGAMLWNKRYEGTGLLSAYSVQQTSDGGYIIAGDTGSGFFSGEFRDILIKTDTAGNLIWSKILNTLSLARSIKQTTDGGFVVTGGFGNPGYLNVSLIKFSSMGNLLWAKSFGGNSDEIGWSVLQTSDGGFIVAGKTRSFGAGDYDVYLIRTDSIGDTLWTKTYGGSSYDTGESIMQTTDGGFIIGGQTQIGTGPRYIFLMKVDINGDTLWSKNYSGSGDNDIWSAKQTSEGGYVIAGSSNEDIYLIKTDSTGNIQWMKIFGDVYEDEGHDVQQTSDGGYIIVGRKNWSCYLIKTDSMGMTAGCNDSNFNAVESSPVIIVTNPLTQVFTINPSVSNAVMQTDSIGTATTLCPSVGINEITTDNLFLISPNPFTSEISITLQKQNLKQATVSIKNILGQTVFKQERKAPLSTGEGSGVRLDLSFLSKGIYLVEVVMDGERTVKKIVKE